MTGDKLTQNTLRQLVEKKFGESVKYAYQCMALERDIFDVTGSHIGQTTLKRIFSLINDPHDLRRSTLDILAQYVGYRDFDLFCKDEIHRNEISSFNAVETVEAEGLKAGDIVVVDYCPKRQLKLECIGKGKFEVLESAGSKLEKGDRVCISQFANGFELIVTDVERDGRSLGAYVGAKQGGLTNIEVLKY